MSDPAISARAWGLVVDHQYHRGHRHPWDSTKALMASPVEDQYDDRPRRWEIEPAKKNRHGRVNHQKRVGRFRLSPSLLKRSCGQRRSGQLFQTSLWGLVYDRPAEISQASVGEWATSRLTMMRTTASALPGIKWSPRKANNSLHPLLLLFNPMPKRDPSNPGAAAEKRQPNPINLAQPSLRPPHQLQGQLHLHISAEWLHWRGLNPRLEASRELPARLRSNPLL